MKSDRDGNPWLSPSRRITETEIQDTLRRNHWTLRYEVSGFGFAGFRRFVVRDNTGGKVASHRNRQTAMAMAMGVRNIS